MPPTCASPPRRSRATSTTCRAPASATTTSRPWRPHRGGRQRSSLLHSLRGRGDASAFIAGFAGDDRYVVDYLADEVLAHQPEDVRRFLLETSILDPSPGRCAMPSSRARRPRGSRRVRDARPARAAQLFMISLDDHRRWFRYHHLFADVLHALLQLERPRDVPDLHRRASRWYAEHGQVEDAVAHAVAAGDVTRPPTSSSWPSRSRAATGAKASSSAGSRSSLADVVDNWPASLSASSARLMAANDSAVPPRLRALEQRRRTPETELVVADRARAQPAARSHRAVLGRARPRRRPRTRHCTSRTRDRTRRPR